MSDFNISALWAELYGRIKRIRQGATPEQMQKVNQNTLDIRVLYGTTEHILDVIPEDTSAQDPLVKRSQVVGLNPVTISFALAPVSIHTIASVIREYVTLNDITMDFSIALRKASTLKYDMYRVSHIQKEPGTSLLLRFTDVSLTVDSVNVHEIVMNYNPLEEEPTARDRTIEITNNGLIINDTTDITSYDSLIIYK